MTTVSISKEANEDFQRLATEAVKAATYLIERNQGFLPLVLYLQAEGDLAFADFTGQDELEEPPEALDYLALAQAALRPLALNGELRATALACDVRIRAALDAPPSDAIRVDLEHRDGGCISFFQPYSLEAGEIVYGASMCQAQQVTIFAPAREGELEGLLSEGGPTEETDTNG